MFSLLSADLFRTRKTKTYFVLVSLMIAAMVLGLLSIIWLNDIVGSQTGGFVDIIPINTFVDNIGMMNNMIFSSVTFAFVYFNDYVNRQVSKMVTAGYSRILIFVEKLIMYLVIVTSYFVLISVVSLILQMIMGEPFITADSPLIYYIRTYFLQILMSVTIFCFLFLISNIVNKTSLYYIFYFGFVLFSTVVTSLLSLFLLIAFKIDFSFDKYIFTNYVSVFTSASMDESLLLGIAVCVITAVVCGVLGLTLFKRKELK